MRSKRKDKRHLHAQQTGQLISGTGQVKGTEKAMNGVSKCGSRAEGSTAAPDLLASPQWWVSLSACSLCTTHLTSFDILECSSRFDCQSGICRSPSLQARNRGCRKSGEEEEIGHFSLSGI